MTQHTPEVARTSPGGEVALRLSNVSKTYPGVRALWDVSIDVLPGEVHAIVGENGAGKSTLIGIAAGSVSADEGWVAVHGQRLSGADAKEAHEAGVAVVYQHPALIPDLSVAENLLLVTPRSEWPSRKELPHWVSQRLQAIGVDIAPFKRVVDLTVEERHLLEIAKALAARPSVLILDEPTEPLVSDEVERLFATVRSLAESGTAVIYISHRIPDVMQIADRITVLRDGMTRGTFRTSSVSEKEVLERIVGRALESTFPAKRDGALIGEDVLGVNDASGHGFSDVSLSVRMGEIFGLAGVSGNGQREFLRALAGLGPTSTTVTLNGTVTRISDVPKAVRSGIAYCPGDRHVEGVFKELTVRENLLVRSLPAVATGGVIRRKLEGHAAVGEIIRFRIKTPSTETTIAALSGGNQQKIMLARTLLARPQLLLIEEPTQGVDVGTRAEIYRILRVAATNGVAIIVLSSDAKELEGLCDRVAVFARGRVARVLEGAGVTESAITGTAVLAESTLERSEERKRGGSGRNFLTGEYLPVAIITAALVGLGAYTAAVDQLFLSTFNISSLLLLGTTLILVALGQQVAMLTGGIDISVGPTLGFLAVVGSFVLTGSSASSLLLGAFLVLVTGGLVGALHGVAICFGRFTPIVATLVTYFLLQGVSLLLRPNPDGFVSATFADWMGRGIGVVPLAFVVAVVLASVAELVLRRSRAGMALRAVGSDEVAAQRLGIRVRAVRFSAYLACSLFVGLGALVFYVQSGVGDATAGTTYTLTSITAVVIGGASVFGARGSFIGALVGALLIQEIVNATVFLGLDQAWQQYFIGTITIVAAGVYSKARRSGSRQPSASFGAGRS